MRQIRAPITSAEHPYSGQPVDLFETLGYEAAMFFGAMEVLRNQPEQPERPSELLLRNVVVEDAVLHARQLCDLFAGSSKKDDITLQDLFPDFYTNHQKYASLRSMKKRLDRVYGNDVPNTYHWAFNKLVMHATKLRDGFGIYTKALNDLEKILRVVIDEVERLIGSKLKGLED
jgi:hypothetical protein